jgi:hypothetical protein|tara:strand:+ start:1433 stop:1651 length:219 start_codon:yes stop_codon:yes gene_type:complete
MFILLCFACTAFADAVPVEDTAAGQQLTDQMTEIRERLEQLAEDEAIEVVQDETTPTEEVEVVAEEEVVVDG